MAWAQVDNACRDQLNQRGRECWKRFRDASLGLHFEMEYRSNHGQGGEPEPILHFGLIRAKDERLMIVDQHRTGVVGTKTSRTVINDKYQFQVSRSPDASPDRLVAANPIGDRKTRLPIGLNLLFFESPVRILGATLESLFDDKAFQILAIKPVQSPLCVKGSGIYVEARCNDDSTDNAERRGAGIYWGIIDPEKQFTVRKCGLHKPHGSKAEMTIETQLGPDGVWFLKDATLSTKRKDGQAGQTERWIASLPIEHQMPTTEFYLPNYGLTEAFLPKEPSRLWLRWVCLIVGVIGTALSGFMIWKRVQRSRCRS